VSRPGPFLLEHSEGGARAGELLALRAEVFAGQAHPPQAREWDALDVLSLHVLARDHDGQPVGAGRLSPDQRIAVLGVLPAWRGHGVGRALLEALLDGARQRGWPGVRLHAPAATSAFFAQAGFLPVAGEPGLLHRRLDGPMAVEEATAAVDACAALIGQARRELRIYSRALDPGLLDAPSVQAALRRFATLRHDKQARILLQDTASPQLLDAPLLRLAQRLPTVFQFRAVCDPVDASYPSAYLVGDAQAYYFRSTGNRHDDGETWLEGAARARQLRTHFEQIWERSRPWSEHRALGL
jgi:GNAT superfamily N-acetyltransferase